VPKIPYYLSSPEGDASKNNQPSRYNDETIIGYEEKPKEEKKVDPEKDYDVFRVSETYGGRIMPE